MQEAEGLPGLVAELALVGAHRFEQAEGADDIGLDEVFRAVDAAVDMRLGRKIDHRTRLVLGQQAADQFDVANVALDENMARIAVQR